MSISLRLLLTIQFCDSLVSCFCLFIPYQSFLHSLQHWEQEGQRVPVMPQFPLEPDSNRMLIRHTFFPEHLTSCFASGLLQLFGCESCFTYFVENLQVHKIVFMRFLGNSFKIRMPLCMEQLGSRGMQSQGQMSDIQCENFKLVVLRDFLKNLIKSSKNRSNKYSSFFLVN